MALSRNVRIQRVTTSISRQGEAAVRAFVLGAPREIPDVTVEPRSRAINGPFGSKVRALSSFSGHCGIEDQDPCGWPRAEPARRSRDGTQAEPLANGRCEQITPRLQTRAAARGDADLGRDPLAGRGVTSITQGNWRGCSCETQDDGPVVGRGQRAPRVPFVFFDDGGRAT